MRKLKRLRISEVSSVDKSAGEGCMVLIRKRHEEAMIDKVVEALAESITSIVGANLDKRETAQALATTFAQADDYLKREAVPLLADDDDADDRDEAAAELLRLTAEETRANPSLTRLEAATRVRDRLQAKEKQTPTKKEDPPMPDTLENIFKDAGGLIAICKNISISGHALGLTPDQFDEQLTKQAQADRRNDETFGKSYERLFARPEVWQAQNIIRDAQYVAQIAKSHPDLTKSYPDYMSIEPVQVSGDDVTDKTDKAHQQLMALAEKQRAKAPWLSIEQAYERVFTAKENAEFSRRAVTSFPRIT